METVINDYCHIDEFIVGNINFYEEKKMILVLTTDVAAR